ncbi:MAG: polysulfide reductase NrfD [Desulfohalobiaceae bacterium]|nr:polysulfide reductase NrfD [Desulfohalobiaceae bacterium]
MLEKALDGSKTYWAWIIFLLAVMGVGSIFYIIQLQKGLMVTGMSRDVSWGFYIAQFTYFVGVAASAVMLVLPLYLHNQKEFKKMVILGEFMAVAAVVICMGFIVVDLGQPQRMLNVMLYPTPNSMLFYDMIVLTGYLLLNIVIAWNNLHAEWQRRPHPRWLQPLIYLSIVWAVSIHTVTAFLIQGLPGRHLWLTAIMASRFLASAFCSGPAILIILALIAKKFTRFDPGREAIRILSQIVTYAMIANVFLFLCELFTAYYSNIPGHEHILTYFFLGLHGKGALVGWAWVMAGAGILSLVILIPSRFRNNQDLLLAGLVLLILATWIDKGLLLIVGGFIPNPMGAITQYAPTGYEIMISAMIYATGLLILTILWKVAIGVKKEIGEA